MKILKPGKVEQRKFECPKCGCVYVANDTEITYIRLDGIDYVYCPTCNQSHEWDKGEPYGEPTQEDDLWRLASLVHDAPQKHANSWPEAAELIARYLIENGVTFREV